MTTVLATLLTVAAVFLTSIRFLPAFWVSFCAHFLASAIRAQPTVEQAERVAEMTMNAIDEALAERDNRAK